MQRFLNHDDTELCPGVESRWPVFPLARQERLTKVFE
jgi:hypothetical protein